MDMKFLEDQFGGFTVELAAGQNVWQYWNDNKVITVEMVAGKYQVTEIGNGKKVINLFKNQTSVIGAVLLANSKTAIFQKPA